MFQKPAFGTNTSGFGMQSTFGSPATATASPFGGFKPAAGSSAFGAPPAFGAATAAQPATGGGLFGGGATTGGLFGAQAAPAAAGGFGASTGFGFGANTSTGGLFNSTGGGGGLFQPQQNNTAFGAKPTGFGFGSAPAAAGGGGGLFGNTQQAGSSLFGQQSNAMGGGGLFANNAGGFGGAGGAGAAGAGSAHVKYSPVVGTDVVVKSGVSQNINIKHHCITCMKEYESKSLEELRLEDYTAGRKGVAGGAAGVAGGAAGAFGFSQPQQDAKPLFNTSTFGAATTSAPSVFGGGALSQPAFGQTNTFSFGGGAQPSTNTTGLFGAQKPAFGATTTTGGGLFGAAASTPASTFGTNTSTFGFGSNLQNQAQSAGGLFGAKPATSGFGAAPASSAAGGFGSFGGGLFGAKPLQAQAPTFGAPQPGAGALGGGFGTSTSAAGGMFGSFGKPATTQPAFGFGAAQPALGGLNTSLGSSFGQNKPGVGGFGALGGGLFPQQNNNTFRTGLDGGLGGGMFGNSAALGGGSLGLTLNNNSSALANLSGASAAGNVHEQILALAARPYGDSPLFKDLPDSSTTAADVLKPTMPSAQAAVLSGYRVTSPSGIRLELKPRSHVHDKKSLFDGLEESDASLEDKLSLKPSRKRLVLRPHDAPHRTQEEPQPDVSDSQAEKENISSNHLEEAERVKRNLDFPNNNNVEVSSDRQASWLSASKVPWSDHERSPRLYPNLDNDLLNEVSERRASWLTTKTLRPPLAAPPDSAESSVRELGVREAMPTTPPALTTTTTTADHHTDTLDLSEEEGVAPREFPPHPAGVKCTRPGYYTIPSLDEITRYLAEDGSCTLPHLTIGRTNYGNVHYDSEIDVANLDIDALVHFLNKEVIVYPEEADKPAEGAGLNRRAVVTLDRIWPRDKTERRPITDPDRLLKMEYEAKLRRVCDKHDTKFIEYRPHTGSWVFRVEHFSKYGLTDSDEEDEPTPEVLKRQLLHQPLQKNAAPVPKPLAAPSAGLGGLGGLGLSGGGLISAEDTIFAMQQTSINLLSGASKAFEMDTTEENGESHSLYQDNRAFGVKSPTSELARLEHRQSAHVQLMKASLYQPTEMEDDISVSSGDQLVPMSAPPSLPEPAPPAPRLFQPLVDSTPALHTEEVEMKPLLVQPHTIVLNYHRKVPPFKHTIAGRLGAACVADMSVSRARHSRVGFGPRAALVYATTYDTIHHLPNNAELSSLSRYVAGRGSDDWSEPVVARLALAQPDAHYNVTEVLSQHLESLFEFSTFGESESESARERDAGAEEDGTCGRLRLMPSARERYAALQHLIANEGKHNARPGAAAAYRLEVWKLCDALWGADLENDGVPGSSPAAVVGRHRRLLAWLTAAVADVTDDQLATPAPADHEDECDGHSGRIWTLLLGGRVLEACRVARQHGDLNLATLLAQAAGDPSFRSLISRQLSVWRDCGADSLVSAHKLAILQLISGSPPPQLCHADWLQALRATASYLCPQVPSLEQVIRRYEALFSSSPSGEEVDLTLVPEEEGMRPPRPEYLAHCDLTIHQNGVARRPLDLRYALIRARAFNSRVRTRPDQYTADPLDYSLSFLLGVWFGAPCARSVAGAAEQLEASGAWHRAVHALSYLPDDKARAHLIRGVVSRHAPCAADSAGAQAQLALLERLRVPRRWVLRARAHRAKYQHMPGLEAELLAGAGAWNAAHKVLIEDLLPEAVLADDLQRIAPLLEQLSEAARRHEVRGWERGGQALHHYIHVCEEIRKLVNQSPEERGGRCLVSQRLEALRPRVAAACKALPLPHLHHKRPAQLAARAEMGGRLVQLAVAGGEPPHHLAALLNALQLPPDCTQHAHHKITTDLAEQASELCIESATDSPVSSHHRASAV